MFFQMCRTLAYEALPYVIGEEAHILAHNEEVEELILCGKIGRAHV